MNVPFCRIGFGLFLLLIGISPAGAQTVTFSIPTDIVANPGEVVDVPVTVNLGGAQLSSLGGQVNISDPFASVHLVAGPGGQLVDFVVGPILPGPTFDVSSPAPPSARFGFFDQSGPITQDGVLFTLRVEISPSAVGGQAASLDFDEVVAEDINLQSLQTQRVSGMISIPTADGKVNVTGRVTYYDGTTPIPAVSVDLGGDDSQSKSTLADGLYGFETDSGGDYTVTASKNDDTPASNGVSTLDIALTRRHILNITALDTDYKMIAADVNNSNSVSTLDIALIRRVILNIDQDFPGGLWRCTTGTFTNPPFVFETTYSYVNLTVNVPNQNLICIKHGDVNESWAAAGAAPKVQPPARSIGIWADRQAAPSGSEVRVPVRVDRFSDVGGYQFTLAWDPEVLGYEGLDGFGLPGMGPAHFGTHRVDEGLLTTAWDDPEVQGRALADGASLFEVRFRVIGGEGAESPLVLTSSVTVMEAHTGDLQPLAIETAPGAVAAGDLPATFSLSQNYPNPFNPVTSIHYTLPRAARVRLVVYDALGRQVVTLVDERQEAGRQQTAFRAGDLPSGVYYYRLTAGAFSEVKKMTLLK